MIYCVEFDDVERHVRSMGWRAIGKAAESYAYAKGSDVLIIPAPNVFGHIPETIVLNAFDRAGVAVPHFRVFWCD